MSHVATIISAPAQRALSPDVANMAMGAVGASAVAWLDAHVACDIALPDDIDAQAALMSLRRALAPRPLDVVVQKAAGRRKKFLIADMDSTMIDQECIDELAAEAGLKDHVASITVRAMNGEIAFEPALRERVALLTGLSLDVVEKVLAERITLAAGGATLVGTMKRHGAWTALVSGGFTLFTREIAARLGFDEDRANTLRAESGRLTGEVAEPILGRAAKAQALTEIAARLGIGAEAVMAVGDGANDLDMLGLAGAGVAIHAKPTVAAQARHRIDHGDLTALLYMQGYARAEFVDG